MFAKPSFFLHSQRSMNCAVDWPPYFEATLKPPEWNAKVMSNLPSRKSFTVNHEASAQFSIVGLLGYRKPFAIIGRIVAVVIDALDAISSLWPWSHIRDEAFKTGAAIFAKTPAVADYNSSSAITMKAFVLSVAATDGVTKCRIFWRVCQTVLGSSLFAFLCLPTAAASARTDEQCSRHNRSFNTAFTAAKRAVSDLAFNGPVTESLA